MKIALVALSALALAGCDNPQAGYVNEKVGEQLAVLIDKQTGCQYVTPRTGGAITIRLNSEGRPICGLPGLEAL